MSPIRTVRRTWAMRRHRNEVVRAERRWAHDPERLHKVYSEFIEMLYARRQTDAFAMEALVDVCERQIALAPTVARTLVPETGPDDAQAWQCPGHPGFEYLARFRAKQGDYTEAARLCREAQTQGWEGLWPYLIEHYERALGAGPAESAPAALESGAEA